MRLVKCMALALEGTLALSMGYLLALLLAARDAAPDPSESPPAPSQAGLRFVVLIPAHNEEAGIGATLDSLAESCYDAGAWRAVVIADNCTDGTAERVRAAGVEVWERTDPDRRGKGYALGWAMDQLRAQGPTCDAVVVLDADCVASPNLLSAIDRRLRSGASAVQANYLAGNADASHASALRCAGFALMNTVRFQGKQQLGLSCGLVGTGMAFTMDLLERQPWTATGLVEDGEYHMRLVLGGERTEFVADASVSSPVPTSLRGGSDQQARWEQGKLQLIRSWSPRLVASGLARRDIVRVHAGLECLVPPQSLIAAGSIGSTLAGLLLGSRTLIALSAATIAAQCAFVLGGLRLVRAPAQVYRALLVAPALIVSKVALYARLLGGRGPSAWIRTERDAPVCTWEG